ncbi:uncharacterized protein F5147DRAFT_694151 [Suillus discolor]|uniref:Uncharacterized protein n=1 Tax=Suillus discolor TaxID=1912936 RepID=A0A9P7F8T9_9AGAM|nr:uncharacterized protein F5147DRAFT_694151 [Suillus discolor]KAG2108649.1 hypothetical protein F5147DRAFT_694151 [Suillus discolor]
MFLALEHSSEAAYEDIRTAGSSSMLSVVVDHMCINTCVAFVGPYADRETCPERRTLRYDQVKLQSSRGKVKVLQAVFHTIPIGPHMQALWRNLDSARQMQYRRQRTQQIAVELI